MYGWSHVQADDEVITIGKLNSTILIGHILT